MLDGYAFTVAERFLRYVQIDTQSDPKSTLSPSTGKQKALSQVLVKELEEIGLTAGLDEFGYVYASIPSNVANKTPVICFCSHVDTAPDCSGYDVKPLVHRNYSGEDIVLPDDHTQVLRVVDYPYLKNHIGKDIITASGKTLLGADDKSGLAIIVDFAKYLQTHPEHKHGEIKILFTPDEEIGRGVNNLNLQKLGADFAYTLDGGEAGSLEDETFSANGFTITVHGVIVHPGYAKNKLVNAIKIAGEILNALPKDRLSPETTSGREGFVHPVGVQGIAERACVEFIIRAFDEGSLEMQETELKAIANSVLQNYPAAKVDFESHEQYRNMKPVLDRFPQLIAYAEQAIRMAGLEVKKESIRGGTDGSRLSHLGLPCPNIFTGMQAIHSSLEWIGVEDMEKAVETLVHLSGLWARCGEL